MSLLDLTLNKIKSVGVSRCLNLSLNKIKSSGVSEVLRSLKQVYGARKVRGYTIIDVPPFFCIGIRKKLMRKVVLRLHRENVEDSEAENVEGSETEEMY